MVLIEAPRFGNKVTLSFGHFLVTFRVVLGSLLDHCWRLKRSLFFDHVLDRLLDAQTRPKGARVTSALVLRGYVWGGGGLPKWI